MEKITSIQNPKIKNVLKLSKRKERADQHLFVIEGARELSLAIKGGYTIRTVFVCPQLFEKTDYPDVLDNLSPDVLFEVEYAVFEKIAYRENSDGLLVLAEPKQHSLDDLPLSDNPFLIILESVEKPGNLGAILRTADAAAADAVIICDPLTDVYNPNVIRSGVGCLFTVPVAVCSSAEALSFLKKRSITSFAAELEASQWYHQTDYRKPCAVVMGTEADGLTDFWLREADARIKIPMRGQIDSLNVSVSTAILAFEAMRQRGFNV